MCGGWCSRWRRPGVLWSGRFLCWLVASPKARSAHTDHVPDVRRHGSWKPATTLPSATVNLESASQSASPSPGPLRSLAVSPGRSENSRWNAAVIWPGESCAIPAMRKPVVELRRLAEPCRCGGVLVARETWRLDRSMRRSWCCRVPSSPCTPCGSFGRTGPKRSQPG